MAKSILIIGAGGFIGSYLVEEALRRGYETWAAVRATTSRRYLPDERIRFLELDFNDEEAMREAFSRHGAWDYVVHNLGATKCLNYSDFDRINYGYLRAVVEALRAAGAMPQAFVMMSSLSAMGLGDEKGYTPFTTEMVPAPNTRYGLSKMKAEQWLRAQADVPAIILRPTGVYGPRERDYFLMFKSIKAGFDFTVGFRRQLLTFIYVADLATAALQAIEASATTIGRTYIIAHPTAYTQAQFRAIAMRELGKRVVLPVKCPLWILYAVSVIAEAIGRLRGKPSTLNRDKYIIMKQRNWTADVEPARRDFNFNPRFDLPEGVKEAIKWYRENKWF